MKSLAMAAGSVIATVMVFTALGPCLQHDVQRAVRNATHEWEAPLPPLVKVGINFALNEIGIPMLSRHCAPPGFGPEAVFSPALRPNAGSMPARGCPRPVQRPPVQSGTLVDALPDLRSRQG